MTMKRDVTRALELARALDLRDILGPEYTELVQLLTDMDARTGKRDPSKRKPKK